MPKSLTWYLGETFSYSALANKHSLIAITLHNPAISAIVQEIAGGGQHLLPSWISSQSTLKAKMNRYFTASPAHCHLAFCLFAFVSHFQSLSWKHCTNAHIGDTYNLHGDLTYRSSISVTWHKDHASQGGPSKSWATDLLLQVVVLFQILASPVTNGYKFQSVRLERFNDREVRNLRQLADYVDNCT